MSDRLIFEKEVLGNGMTIYSRKMDVPFALVRIYVPLGHIHNTNGVTPGLAHFLEHMVCNRSERFPELDSFKKFVALRGGQVNAATGFENTKYLLDIPSFAFTEAFRGLVSRVFCPIFTEADIANEVGVIANEIKRKNRWFPAESELGYHRRTKWKYLYPVELRQRMGTEIDLKSITLQELSDTQQLYLDPRVFVLVVGDFDLEVIKEELSQVATSQHEPLGYYKPYHWKSREYHEASFSDENKFTYRLGSIMDGLNFQDAAALGFILNLLTNSVHGVLFEWLRNELGWSYSIDLSFGTENRKIGAHCEISIPVNSYNQSQVVRKKIHDKIKSALSDPRLIEAEIIRRNAGRVFSLQTPLSVINEAEDSLDDYGRIVTERERIQTIQSCEDRALLNSTYERYLSPDVIGEFLSMPK